MAGEEILIVIGVVVPLAILAVIGAYAARYKKVPPDAAMVVYGRKFGGKGYVVLRGGGEFFYPIVGSYPVLPLGVRTLHRVVNQIVTGVTPSGARGDIQTGAPGRTSG